MWMGGLRSVPLEEEGGRERGREGGGCIWFEFREEEEEGREGGIGGGFI